MILNEFEFYAPETVHETLVLLERFGPQAALLAGGTDLMLRLRAGKVAPRHIVSVARIPELRGVRNNGAGIDLGAASTLHEIATSRAISDAWPSLAAAAGLVGSRQVRNVATVGGNLCNAAPSADTAPPLLAMGAEARIRGLEDERRVPLESFFLGPGRNVLRAEELLAELWLPPRPAHTGDCYLKHTIRKMMEIAIVGVGVVLTLAEGTNDICQNVHIVLGAVAPTPLRALAAEASLCGRQLTAARITAAAQAAAEEACPISDVRASAEYRSQMVAVLADDALHQAWQRARSAHA